MTPTIFLILALLLVALVLLTVWATRRFGSRTAVTTAEQDAAHALEQGLAFLLDDSADDKAIAAAQKRKTSRAALRAQVLQEIAAAVEASSQKTAVPAALSASVLP